MTQLTAPSTSAPSLLQHQNFINAGTIGAEIQFLFRDTRGAGTGHREADQTALDVFTEWKTIYVDYSGCLQRAQIDVAELTN